MTAESQCPRRVSNPRPGDYESPALTAELRRRTHTTRRVMLAAPLLMLLLATANAAAADEPAPTPTDVTAPQPTPPATIGSINGPATVGPPTPTPPPRTRPVEPRQPPAQTTTTGASLPATE